MLVQVTARHIKRGSPGFNDRCPVALALAEMGYEKVSVGDRIYLSKGDRRLSYDTPEEAQRWIEQFDLHHQGEPFLFILDKPVSDTRRR